MELAQKQLMDNGWPDNNSNINALIIIAHPDDETIFCGGVMLSFPKWNWTVVCVTTEQNTLRPQEFNKAIQMYKDSGVNIISHLELNNADRNQDLSSEDRTDWENSIRELDIHPDIVLTHHKTHDYHRKHHIPIAEIASDLFDNVWETVYPGATKITAYAERSKVKKVELNADLLEKKGQIFGQCYQSQIDAGIWTGDLSELMKYEFEVGPEIFTSGE